MHLNAIKINKRLSKSNNKKTKRMKRNKNIDDFRIFNNINVTIYYKLSSPFFY